jgi:hypothetical protein
MMSQRVQRAAVLTLLVAVACAQQASPSPTANSTTYPMRYKGMTFTNERYCPNVSLASWVAQESLYHLSTTGANAVSIVVTQYQMTTTSTDIFPVTSPTVCTATPSGYCVTARDSELISAIMYAKQLGFSVMLKLQIDLIDAPGMWRGDIGINMTATQWDAWFVSYTAAIRHYAMIAEATGVEILSVSCELVEASKQDAHWRQVIALLRHIYKGTLTDSANWSPPNAQPGQGEVTDKTWWDAVDVIGVDEYYVTWAHSRELANGTYRTLDELLDLWAGIEVQLAGLHRKFNKSVLFTEIGYCSGVNGSCFKNTAVQPANRTSSASLEAQATQFEAALAAMTKYPWFLGVFWWNWATDAAFGGEGNSCMDPKFKPAEAVLRKWYGATLPAPTPPSYPPVCECWL